MNISESEMEIMKIIWSSNEAVTTAYLLKTLNTGWKHTTVLTFLKRLCEKGVLKAERHGKTNCYLPIISEEEYKKRQTREFLSEIHSGSVKNFLTALYGEKKPSDKELNEIKQWFEGV